jgi:hypothetical protein
VEVVVMLQTKVKMVALGVVVLEMAHPAKVMMVGNTTSEEVVGVVLHKLEKLLQMLTEVMEEMDYQFLLLEVL